MKLQDRLRTFADRLDEVEKEAESESVQCAQSAPGHFFKIGKNYFIRTVTMIVTGKLEAVGDKELLLTSAAWIAETDRFADSLKNGTLKEVEPFPDGEVVIGRGSIIDAVIWHHDLPREQK